MKQAEWNDITWGHTGRQMTHIKSFRLSQKLKTEEKESVKGGNKTFMRSLEPETYYIVKKIMKSVIDCNYDKECELYAFQNLMYEIEDLVKFDNYRMIFY